MADQCTEQCVETYIQWVTMLSLRSWMGGVDKLLS